VEGMQHKNSKLGLGGHSFIEKLGNDSPASFDEQCTIVSECLDNGIRLIDTTYYQERVSLGRVMQKLGRRNEVEVMAWNFFKQPGRENDLVDFTTYERHHIDIMLDELQMNYIDTLVIHVHEDNKKLNQEIKLAEKWKCEGKIKNIALGMVKPKHLENLPEDHPVTHVLAPYNAFNREALSTFLKAKEMGIVVISLSPFIRGWKLEEIPDENHVVSDILLRWVASQDITDQVIVSMRKREWVKNNIESINRGELNDDETILLQTWLNSGD
jgi:aryl-alcohol dehydrogenase-like predicted oxidoreductase